MATIPPGRSRRTALRAGTLAALTAIAGAALACSDPQEPDSPRGLQPGVYVLLSVDGEPLPVSSDVYGALVRAETLFVSSPSTYRVAGAYAGRFGGAVYEESESLVATPDPVTDGVTLDHVLRTFAGVAHLDGDSLLVDLEPDAGRSRRLVYVASPPPPPPGPVASLQLTTADTVVLHGGTIDVRPFVVRGLDATGRWIRNPEFTVETPDGWSSVDGVLVAPQNDESATVRLRSGAAVAEVQVEVVPDLRESRWQLAWRCLVPWDLVSDAAARIGDSSAVELMVDSVRYAPVSAEYGSDFPFVYSSRIGPVLWAKAALYARGVETVWYPDKAVIDSVRYALPVIRQWADSVELAGPSTIDETIPYPTVVLSRVSDVPTYTGTPTTSGMCDDLSYQRGGPVRFEAMP